MPVVHMTEAGDCYHKSPDCQGLRSGQEGGAVQGYELRPVVEVSLEAAVAAGKDRCGVCGGS